MQVVMQLVDGIVRRSSEQLSESTGLLQDILRAAADPQVGLGASAWRGKPLWLCGRQGPRDGAAAWRFTAAACAPCPSLQPLSMPLPTTLVHPPPPHAPQTGEWELPLRPDKLDAMRAVMAGSSGGLDEGLLASCYSWMRKASEDKLDGEGGAENRCAGHAYCSAVRTHAAQQCTAIAAGVGFMRCGRLGWMVTLGESTLPPFVHPHPSQAWLRCCRRCCSCPRASS